MEPRRDNTVVSPLLAVLARNEPQLAADEPVVLSRGGDGLVVRVGDVVFKMHEAGTDEGELWQRLVAVKARSDVFLQPLSPALARYGDRLVTRWPHAEALRPDEASLPWVEAATLLGRLHAQRADAIDSARALPVGGGPRRVLRAVAHLRAAAVSPERSVVLDAFATLGEGDLVHACGERVVHGDFHLGQIVRCRDGLRFIDVEEVGRGDPAWDLARPAAWYATGLMPEGVWQSFWDAYRAAAGPGALGLDGARDPWAALEAPARALVVQSAARGVLRREPGAPLDDFDVALLRACERIALSARDAGTNPRRTKVEGS